MEEGNSENTAAGMSEVRVCGCARLFPGGGGEHGFLSGQKIRILAHIKYHFDKIRRF